MGWCVEMTYVESWNQGQKIETHFEVAVVAVVTAVVVTAVVVTAVVVTAVVVTAVVYLVDNDQRF